MAIKPRVKFGTSGDDTLDGTDQGETSFEFDGNNANTAGGGNDHAFGGRGKDVSVGGPGNDTFLIRQGTGVLSSAARRSQKAMTLFEAINTE